MTEGAEKRLERGGNELLVNACLTQLCLPLQLQLSLGRFSMLRKVKEALTTAHFLARHDDSSKLLVVDVFMTI